jgi:acyl carrier protein
MMEIPHKLKEYIDNNRGSLPPITDPDEPLQIDSLGLIRMVAFLESELGYRVEDEELIAENFATCGRWANCLPPKRRPHRQEKSNARLTRVFPHFLRGAKPKGEIHENDERYLGFQGCKGETT